jgi:hypothetical protein
MPAVRSVYQSSVVNTAASPPTGMQAGDLLLAFESCESNFWDVTLTGGTPEWELLASKATTVGGSLGLVASGVWWKAASAADADWVIGRVGVPDMYGYTAVAVAAVTGAALQAPLITASADQTATTAFTTVTSPAGPPPAVGDLELRWVAGDDYSTSGARSWSSPGSTVELADISASYVAAQLTSQTLTTGSSPSRNHIVTPGLLAAHGFTVRIQAAGSATVLIPRSAAHRAATW